MNILTTARTVAYAIAAVAGAQSYGHQHTLLHHSDLGVYAWAVPLTVDLLAFIAAMVRNSDVADDMARRAAGWTLLAAGTMAIAANVAVGTNWVQRIVGIWTVAAYLIAEWFVSKLKAKPVPVPEPATKTQRRPPAAERVYEARMLHPRASLAYVAKKADVKPATARRVLETVPTSPAPAGMAIAE